MPDTPQFDQSTASALRRIMEAGRAGRVGEARLIAESALAEGCDPAALHALIGSLLVREGEFDAAIRHLEQAHIARPSDPIIVRNRAEALVAAERYDEAVAGIPAEVAAFDRSGQLWRLRGFAAQMAGRPAVAREAYGEVLRTHPGDWESWNNLGTVLESLDAMPEAIAAFRRGSELNPAAIQLRLNLALALRLAGDLGQAEAVLKALVRDFPGEVTPLQYLFGVLKERGLDADARVALEAALERNPADVGMLIALGREQLLSFEIDEASRTFRRALAYDPANKDAFLGLADAAERKAPERLGELLDEAEAAAVDADALSLLRALVAWRAKRFSEGASALRSVPDSFDPIRRWHLQGQLLDALGDYDSAFEAFSRMNRVLAEEPTRPLERAREVRSELADRLRRTTAQWRDSWAAPPLSSEVPAPVFLVGHPRSGTTLLDTMLMSHPGVCVMEERPVLSRLRAETGGFEAIARMSGHDVRRAQRRYFDIAAEYADLDSGRLLVDKSPLHMQNVPQIYRLFPDARFIIALRHPADVILSCYMAKFVMNSSMANFVRLDTAAEFYDLSFSLWEQSSMLFPIQVLPVVYEELVRSPEQVLRPLLEFLGLEWRDGVLDHRAAARDRGIISTASYAQVTEPLHQNSVGRWRHYQDHLAPALPLLEPWIEALGYGATADCGCEAPGTNQRSAPAIPDILGYRS